MNKNSNAGFTLFEVIIAITILCVLATIVVTGFISFKKNTDLNNNTQEFIGALRLAQSRTVSSEDYSKYGVYIDANITPNMYVVFKGDNYVERITASDKIYYLQNTLEFYNISLGGGNEIIFNRLTGAPDEFGSIFIRAKADVSQSRTIYVANSGSVGLIPGPVPSESGRVKDTRHVQFNYAGVIDTLDGTITLTLNDTVTHSILIKDYLKGDELEWSEPLVVEDSNQIIKIIIYKINSSDTLFGIYRDRRYNDKSLKISISGENLIQYTANGVEVSALSANVSGLNW